MAKNSGSKNGGSGGANGVGKKPEMAQDEKLQAVVLTDSFETRFMPLSALKPRCLLPLANVPLIEYTLEFLSRADVREVYLVCSAHAEQISEYIENSKWNLPWSPFKITIIMTPESRSVGDAMRDIDNRGIIAGDFVLISGDVVTNVEFEKFLDFHKKMHAKDKDHVMTMCLSKSTKYPKTRSHKPATFVLDKQNDRCIYYQDIPFAISKEKTSVVIDPELLNNVEEFVLRKDLIDCRIDICTSQVPPLFQDNFDYQTLRSDFVKGVISSDLLGKTVYAYITDEYAARAENWHTYDAISQDFLGRWLYPVVLDSNMFTEDQTYSYESSHIYKENDVVLAQSCKIGKCTAIGSKSKIGEGTYIENSVIGRNCQIGGNITIKNSYIWDNTIVGNNTKISHSIVASNAKIGSEVVLDDGCIVGFDVCIDNNMSIPKGTKISATPVETLHGYAFDSSSLSENDDDDDNELEVDYHSTQKDDSIKLATELVGANGVGYIYESEVSEDDEFDMEHQSNTLSHQVEELYLSDDSISSTTKKGKKKRSMSINSIYTDREGHSSDSEDDEEDFEQEGIATIERAMENNHDLDTALLELNTLRMSMNVTYHEVRKATTVALLRRVYHFIATKTLGPKDAVNKVFSQWMPLYKRQCFEQAEFIDLMDILMEQTIAIGFEAPDLILFSIYNLLYDNDILEEDIIYEWWDTVSNDAYYADAKKLVAKWVEWLRNADEETSSEDDDHESGESD